MTTTDAAIEDLARAIARGQGHSFDTLYPGPKLQVLRDAKTAYRHLAAMIAADLSEDFHSASRCGVEGQECPGCGLATYKAEVKHADVEREEAERNRDAAREELAKTRAELDEAKRVIEAARLCVADIKAAWSDERIGPWLTTGQRALFAALDVHDANPATTAEPADEPCDPTAATLSDSTPMLCADCGKRHKTQVRLQAEPADEPKASCSCIVQPFLAPPRVVHLSTCEAKPAREQCEQVDCHNFGGLPEVCGTGPLFDAPDAAS